MNKTIETFTREKILEGLAKLPDDWQHTFRRMYSHKDLTRPIDQVVACIAPDKLDWALTQVENSIKKLTPP